MFSFKLIAGGIIRVLYNGKIVGDCWSWFEVEELQKTILQKVEDRREK